MAVITFKSLIVDALVDALLGGLDVFVSCVRCTLVNLYHVLCVRLT